jgi:hypothetical protein
MSLRASTPRARLIAPNAGRDEADLPPLVIDRVMPDGRHFHLDFTDLPYPRLARELLGVLLREMQPGGGVQATPTAVDRRQVTGEFVRFVAREHPGCERLALVAPPVINAWERHLVATKSPKRAHAMSAVLLWLLRGGTELLSPATSARLQYGPSLEQPSKTPAEPYSPYVAAQLISTCEKEILATVERIAQGMRPRDEGVHPGRDPELWKVRANQLVAVAERGLLAARGSRMARELTDVPRSVVRLALKRIYAYLYLSSHDLIPFLTLFILKSGMELQSALELRSDCLSGSGGGYLMVSYNKRRAHRASPPPLRVKDGGRTTAGGLLRLVLRLTELSRRHSDDDLIFTAMKTRTREFAGLTAHDVQDACRAFTARHGICDDDAKPLGTIEFRRLRKTQKALRYMAARGQLDVMATGHSIEVAGTHYANVRALDDLHEEAIERALNEALAADTSGDATVINADTESALAAGDRRVAQQLGLSDEAARGGTDLWLARCRDFFNAPHGSPNTPCATPHFGCVGCANALVGPSKLPAVHAFSKHAERQAEALAEPVWEAIYGRAYAGAVDIIGRFSRAEDEAAQLLAEGLTVALPVEVAA